MTPARGDPGANPAARIFISVASYRDRQLGPTLEDCLAKARFPDRLSFGVCWQHGSDEAAPEVLGDPRCRVIDVDWRVSRGSWWARAQTTALWQGEDWFLQLDAHHRFARGWDQVLLEQAAATGSERPLLTAILPSYNPDSPDDDLSESWGLQIRVDRFVDGIPRFIPALLPGSDAERPVRARFLCAHFVFAPGALVDEVAVDPDLYMFGGEPVMALRAYSHGFDLFHPGRAVIWHEYRDRADHQRDHSPAAGLDRTGHHLDSVSREKASRFLREPHVGRYGLGRARSAAQYESYAGISFRECRIQDYTRHGGEPPNPPADPDWAMRTRERHVRLVLDAEQLPLCAARSPFWVVVVSDADGLELTRADADRQEIARVCGRRDGLAVLDRWLESTALPSSWLIWCPEADGSWHESNRITGPVVEIDLQDELAERPRSVSRYSRETNTGFEVWPVERPDLVLRTNRSGMLILELADGLHSLLEISGIVAEAFGLEGDPTEQVSRFAADAAAHGLLAP